MKRISPKENLQLAILELENKQFVQGTQLKQQFEQTYESLRPINIFKNVVKEATSSAYVIDNLFGSIAGFLSGYFSKKMIVGESHSPFRKIIGMLAQFGITNMIAKNPEILKSIGKSIFQHFFSKKEEIN